MRKKCALILSGFLRNEANLTNLKTFLERNLGNYSIDVFICSYDVIGLTKKASKADFSTTEVTKKTFAPILGVNDCRVFLMVEPFKETQKFINNFIQSENLVEVVKCGPVIDGVRQSRVPTSIEWELNKMLSQFHMNWLNIQEIKKQGVKYDVIIKSRLDLNHHQLPSVPQDVEEGVFYGKSHKWISKTDNNFNTGTKVNSFPFIYDHCFLLHFNDLTSLERAYSLESLCKRYRDGGRVKGHQLSCEVNQSVGLFMEGDLKKFIPYECKVKLNRVSKY